jgi:hypothetical protein
VVVIEGIDESSRSSVIEEDQSVVSAYVDSQDSYQRSNTAAAAVLEDNTNMMDFTKNIPSSGRVNTQKSPIKV